MKHFEINGHSPRVFVTFGWHRDTESYFARVNRVSADWTEDEELLFVGETPGEVRTVRHLAELLAPFATLPRDVRVELVRDRARESGRLELVR
jgi:hypothetical protein